MSVRNLDALFAPSSVAVIGVSERADNVGHVVFRNLRDGGFAGPIWTVDPKHTPYRDAMKIRWPIGYAGKMGYSSAATTADFVMLDMVAEAASGNKTPKEAAERAQKRAERYYKV